MPQVKCPFCSSTKLSHITNSLRFERKADVYQCGDCALVFLDQASFTFPEDFYKADYHQTYLTHIEPDAVDPKVYYEKMKKTTKIWADKFCNLLNGDEVVLDVGCSSGHFIDLVKHKTKKIYGSELNKKEIEFCRQELGFDVSDEPLEKRFKPQTFDYITLIFVLEHIGDPKAFLTTLKTFLKPAGKIIILVPNIMDPLVNFYDMKEFKQFYYCIEHLFYYSPKTVTALFDSVGLKGKVEALQEYPITNHLQWAYMRKPSNLLASRQGVPPVEVSTKAGDAWANLWQKWNSEYQQFLKEQGYADRLWAEVGVK